MYILYNMMHYLTFCINTLYAATILKCRSIYVFDLKVLVEVVYTIHCVAFLCAGVDLGWKPE